MYIRQLRDAKSPLMVEDWDDEFLRDYGKLCAWALAKAHARSGNSACNRRLYGLQRGIRRGDHGVRRRIR